MSFHPFFSDAPPDLQDHLHHEPRRPDPYHQQPRPQWSFPLPYFQEDPAYYALFPKIELSAPAPFLDHPYATTSTYHVEHGLDLSTHHNLPQPNNVKQEPCTTPTSPQFIFEFPGGEDEPPPMHLTPPTRPSSFSEHIPPPDIARQPRPSSPTTDAMRAMMGFFRVDPFASYHATSDCLSTSKRRKRSSTYALMTDPEASSREEPLMLTFQLELFSGGGEDATAEPSDDQACQWPGVLDSPEPLGAERSGAAAGITHAASAGDDVYSFGVPAYALQPGMVSRFAPMRGLTSSPSYYDTYTTTSQQQHLFGTLFDPHLRSSNSTPDSTDSLSFFPNLTSHLDAATARRAPAKMHICWICQKEFPRPSGLATHMNTHSGLKPYKCPIIACSKRFAVRSNARRHLRIHGADPGSAAYLEPGSSDSHDSPGSELSTEEEEEEAAARAVYPLGEGMNLADSGGTSGSGGAYYDNAQQYRLTQVPFPPLQVPIPTNMPIAASSDPGVTVPPANRSGLIAIPSFVTTVGAY